MSRAKARSNLETKPSFTKYRSIRLKFPRLRVIVKDINEIWSLDLAHVDKLAKYNRDVKYFLVEVDRLSPYLRVEPMKTKYTTEAAQAFKKMIKYKQPFSKAYVRKEGFIYIAPLVKKVCFCKEKQLLAKNIIYRYLEEKWTYSYIDKLDSLRTQLIRVLTGSLNLPPIKLQRKMYQDWSP